MLLSNLINNKLNNQSKYNKGKEIKQKSLRMDFQIHPIWDLKCQTTRSTQIKKELIVSFQAINL